MGEVGLLDRGIQGASITDPLTWNRKLDGLGNLGRARPSLHRFDGLQCKDMADLACCPDVCAVHRDLLLYGICCRDAEDSRTMADSIRQVDDGSQEG